MRVELPCITEQKRLIGTHILQYKLKIKFKTFTVVSPIILVIRYVTTAFIRWQLIIDTHLQKPILTPVIFK